MGVIERKTYTWPKKTKKDIQANYQSFDGNYNLFHDSKDWRQVIAV